MKSFILSIALAAATMTAPVAHAATLQNASFEEPGEAFTGTFEFVTLNAGSPDLTGWTISGGSIDRINKYWQASNGRFSLDMSGNGAGAISQFITDLNVGRSYRVYFDMSGNPDGGPTEKTMSVSVGTTSGNFSYNVTGIDRENMRYKTKYLSFVAKSTSALLTFTSTTDGPWGPALDNVNVAQVPVPATAPLLLAGLGGLAMLRRRRRA